MTWGSRHISRKIHPGLLEQLLAILQYGCTTIYLTSSLVIGTDIVQPFSVTVFLLWPPLLDCEHLLRVEIVPYALLSLWSPA